MSDQSVVVAKQLEGETDKGKKPVISFFPYCTDGSEYKENSKAPDLPEPGEAEQLAENLFALPGGQPW